MKQIPMRYISLIVTSALSITLLQPLAATQPLQTKTQVALGLTAAGFASAVCAEFLASNWESHVEKLDTLVARAKKISRDKPLTHKERAIIDSASTLKPETKKALLNKIARLRRWRNGSLITSLVLLAASGLLYRGDMKRGDDADRQRGLNDGAIIAVKETIAPGSSSESTTRGDA